MPGYTWDVVGIGENSVDLIYRVPTLPGMDAKVRASSHRRQMGGQIATALCTCASLGLRTRYVGAFGNDEHGALIRAELERRGVDIRQAVVRDAPNRHAVILVDERSGVRSVIWQRHAALALRPEDISRSTVAGARVLHVDEVDEDAAIAAANLARQAGMIVTTDIDRVTEKTPELIAAATFPILAEHVPSILTGEADTERALRQIRERHDGVLCVTLGSRGSMLLAADRLHAAPGFRVDAVDTTGAGDVFRGALICSLLRGDDPDAMLRFANAAAAISCTRQGAIDGIPALEEIEQLVNRN